MYGISLNIFAVTRLNIVPIEKDSEYITLRNKNDDYSWSFQHVPTAAATKMMYVYEHQM